MTAPNITEGDVLAKFNYYLRAEIRLAVLKITANSFQELACIAFKIDGTTVCGELRILLLQPHCYMNQNSFLHARK